MRIEKIAMPGLAELDAQLAQLGTAVATEIAADAIRASAELLQDAWQHGAPYDPNSRPKSWTVKTGEVRSRDYGHLNQNIRVGRVAPRKESAVVYKVTTGDAFWGYFVEHGTVRMKARPWARPIVESVKQACINVQVDILRAGIESVVGGEGAKKYGPVMANGRNG